MKNNTEREQHNMKITIRFLFFLLLFYNIYASALEPAAVFLLPDETWCTVYDMAELDYDDVMGTGDNSENQVQKDSALKEKTALQTLTAFDLQINNVTDLLNFATQVNAGNDFWEQTITLTADIDLTGIEFVPIGTPDNYFAGTFNGDGFTISSLTINEPNMDYVGLFGYTCGGQLIDINIADCNIEGKNNVGALAGNNGSFVFGCSASGQVTGELSIGGLIGLNNGKVAYSNTSCSVEGQEYIGGFVGRNESAFIIIDCYSESNVRGNSNVGGFIGFNDDTIIENCFAFGNVTADGDNIGGFVGKSFENSVFDNCSYINEINSNLLSKALKIEKSIEGIQKSTATKQQIATEISSLSRTIDDYLIEQQQTYTPTRSSPVVLLPDYTFSAEIAVENTSNVSVKYMATTALYYKENGRLYDLFLSEYTISANSTENIIITADFSEIPDLNNYIAKTFMWEYHNLKPYMKNFEIENISNTKCIYGKIKTAGAVKEYSFIPAEDGFYEIRTDGTGTNGVGDLYGELFYTDKYIDDTNEGYGNMPVLSTAGVSTKNKWTYNLKAGIEYRLRLSSTSNATGEFYCTIKKNETLKPALAQHNLPVLSAGMIPIKWIGDRVIVTTTADPDWFDYNQSENKWANVMLSDGVYKYNTVTAGQIVEENELGSMFVWIPRYAYKIEKSPIENNVYSNKIDTIYLKGITDIPYSGSLPNGYIAHPAFKENGLTLSGFWVAKFQASSLEGGANGGGETTSNTLQFKPNITAWQGIGMSSIVEVSKRMNGTASSGNKNAYR